MKHSAAWRYYLQFYRGTYAGLAVAVVLAILQALLIAPLAKVIRVAFDEAIPQSDVQGLLRAGALILVIQLSVSAVAFATRYLTLRVTKVAIYRLRTDILARLFMFSRSYLGQTDRGQLHTVIVQDSERLDVLSNVLVSQFLPAILTASVLIIILAVMNWFLLLVMLLAFPIMWLISRYLGSRVRSNVKEYNRSFESFSQGILFVLQAIDLTRLQTAEEVELQRQESRIADLRATSERMSWLQAAYSMIQGTVLSVSGVLVLVIGGLAVIRGVMTLGDLISFYVILGLLNGQMRSLISSIANILIGRESLYNLYDLAHVKEHQPYRGHKRVTTLDRVEVRDVTFGYRSEPILRDVSVLIQPRQALALIGPNGSGKSTLVNLILGFYRPDQGMLFADGRPYDDLDINQLRQLFGVVPQDPFIFSGTVRENIVYGATDPALPEIEAAARLAMAHDFIAQLPEGYETRVGENGVLLSGGQRQRIAIARALLRQPRLLILDEPTNHLDQAAIAQLMQNLRALPSMPAMLLISHDQTVTAEVDTILRIDNGRLVEMDASSQRPAQAETAAKDAAIGVLNR